MNNQLKWKYPEAIVDCEWLKDQLGNKNIRLYDCTTYLHYTDSHPLKPYDVESGLEDYIKSHIPGAAFLDLQNEFSDQTSPYRFTLPDYGVLAETFKRHGIGVPHQIILYSRNGMQWSTRFWWMIHVLGYKNVSILDGGFNEWERLNLPIETKEIRFNPAEFEVNIDPEIFVGKEEVLGAIDDKNSLLINALTEDLHLGENPRYGRPGRIPESINIPFHEFVDSNSNKLKSVHSVFDLFNQSDVNPENKIINYCGGGIAATLNTFALYQLDFKKIQIYDNSMSEWAMDNELPIESGRFISKTL